MSELRQSPLSDLSKGMHHITLPGFRHLIATWHRETDWAAEMLASARC